MVNQRPRAALLALIAVVSLVSGFIGALIGAGAVLWLTDKEPMQTVLAQPTSPTPLPSPTPTRFVPTPAPTVTPLPPTPTLTPTPDVPVVELKTMEVAEQAGRSVVTVLSLQAPEDEAAEEEVQTLGSGLVLDTQGHIVTNYHVVANPDNLQVILPDGRKYRASVVGVDKFTDLAVIKIRATGLVPATLGDSSNLRLGQRVIAIGSALGEFRNSVTVGVVSGLNRRVKFIDKAYALENLIQTDAAINHGNSGGPLVDLNGRVIGINTVIVRRQRFSDESVQGIGFAIPINTVKRIVSDLIADGRVARPYLGVTVRMVTPQLRADLALAVDRGAWIEEVIPGSPAARAGLRHGDVILSIDGVPVDEDHPFLNVLARRRIGQTVTLRVNRVGEELTFVVTLEQTPKLNQAPGS